MVRFGLGRGNLGYFWVRWAKPGYSTLSTLSLTHLLTRPNRFAIPEPNSLPGAADMAAGGAMLSLELHPNPSSTTALIVTPALTLTLTPTPTVTLTLTGPNPILGYAMLC